LRQPVQTLLHTSPIHPGPVPRGVGALSGTALLSNGRYQPREASAA